MAVIENLDIVLGARTEKLDNGLDRATRRVTKFDNDIGKIATRPLRDIGQNLLNAIPGGALGGELAGSLAKLGPAGAVAGTAVAAAFVGIGVAAAGASITINGVREQLTQIDDAADAAKRLGFQFNELVTLRLALSRSTGLGQDQIDSSLTKMQLNLAEARSGAGPLADQLKSLGLDAGKLLEDGPVEAMKQIADAAQQMKAPIDQSKLAFDLFGKSGVGLGQLFRDGASAIDEAAAKAKRLGLTLSQAQTEQVGAANDAWEDMQLVATGAFRQIAAEFSVVITTISNDVVGVGAEFTGWRSKLSLVVNELAIAQGFAWDLLEAFTASNRMLEQIANGELGLAMETATSALDFRSGLDMIKRLDEARSKAAEAAKTPRRPEANADAIEAGAQARNQANEANKRAQDERDREAARNKEAVADRLAGLRDEVSVLGKAASAADRLKLARQGATAAQLAEFDALTAAKQKHDDLKDAMDRGKQIAAQYRTPMQEFDAQLQDLNKLFNVGAIDFNTYAKATRDAAKKAGDSLEKPERPKVSMLQKGSVEAFQQGNKNAEAAKDNKRSEKLLEMVNVNLEKIEQKLRIQNIGVV